MNQGVVSDVAAIGLFFGMLVLLELGRRIGHRRQAKDLEGARAGLGAIEGAIFGLMGLLIAFTFSGAATRFDARRALIVEEANDIGTAWLRLDLLPPEPRDALREDFRRYLDARLAAYANLRTESAAARTAFAESNAIQTEIWRRAVDACSAPEGERARVLLLPALNAMFDITTTRTMALQTHPPTLIFAMLGTLALVCALLAGYGMSGGRRRSVVHMVGFALIMSFTIFVILDLEHPRLGLIRVDMADHVLTDLRKTMD